MNPTSKLSRAQSTAIAAGLSVALIGGGVAVAQQINLPNQSVVPADAQCESLPADAGPIAIGDATSSTWDKSTDKNWGGEGLMPGGRVYRSYAVRNLDARAVKWTINLSESTATPDAYFALGAAIGSVTSDAADTTPDAIQYPQAPVAPEAEKPADGFLWLIGENVPTSLSTNERGDLIAEVIIPSGSYVAITDWVAVPPGYEWSSPNQQINPVWQTTAHPGELDEAGNFTPADDSAPDFIPIGCDEEPPAPTQADTHTPVAVNKPTGIIAGETPDAKDYVKDADKLPDGTTFEFAEPKPDFTTPGDKPVTITVTYPDGSTDTVTVTIPVKAKPTQADTHTPVAVEKPKEITAGVTPEAKDYVDNADDLPAGTTFEFADPKPDFTTPGDKPVTITVTYPDGSTDTVTVTIPVKAKETTPEPTVTNAEEYQPTVVKDSVHMIGDTLPGAEKFISNIDALPAGTTFEWKTTPNVQRPGNVAATIVATYPDQSSEEITVLIDVREKTTPGNQGSSFQNLSSECQQTVIAGSIGSILGLLIAVVSQLSIPGLTDGFKAANTQIQNTLGIFNPAMADFTANWSGIIGGIVGAVIFLSSIGVTAAKCKAELGSSN